MQTGSTTNAYLWFTIVSQSSLTAELRACRSLSSVRFYPLGPQISKYYWAAKLIWQAKNCIHSFLLEVPLILPLDHGSTPLQLQLMHITKKLDS